MAPVSAFEINSPHSLRFKHSMSAMEYNNAIGFETNNSHNNDNNNKAIFLNNNSIMNASLNTTASIKDNNRIKLEPIAVTPQHSPKPERCFSSRMKDPETSSNSTTNTNPPNTELWLSMARSSITSQNTPQRIATPSTTRLTRRSPSTKRSPSNSQIVSDLFLTEAKAAMMAASKKSGSSSGGEIISRPQAIGSTSDNENNNNNRQVSSNSADAVLANNNYNYNSSSSRRSMKSFVFTAEEGTSLSKDVNAIIPRSRGLSYAIKRTDSSSTFQSLDGLSASYPLIRKDAKNKRKSSSSKKGKKRDRRRSSKSHHHHHHTSSTSSKSKKSSSSSNNSTSTKAITTPSSAASLACYATSCFGTIPFTTTDPRFHSTDNNNNNNTRDDGPEKLISKEEEEYLLLKKQLKHLRRIASGRIPTEVSFSNHSHRSTRSSSRHNHSNNNKKNVHFSEPLVTCMKYRPYTQEHEIPILYFQEEELEELEWDRETVPGDQFECEILNNDEDLDNNGGDVIIDNAIINVEYIHYEEDTIDE